MFFAKKVAQISYNTKYSIAIENTHNFRDRINRKKNYNFQGNYSFLDVFGRIVVLRGSNFRTHFLCLERRMFLLLTPLNV